LVVDRGGARIIVLVVWPLSVVIAIVAWKLNLRFTVARYAPCFVAGIACFGLLGKRRPVPFFFFPLAVLVLLLAYMTAYRRFGLQAGLGILATFSVGAMLPFFARMRSPALKWTSQTVAKYSYGIYLFHTPCIWIAFGKMSGLGVVGSSFCLLALIGATSAVGYHLIEEPLIRVGRRLAAQLTGTAAVTRSVVPVP
jgi:peptidoglycan/LPS O-acetylase OafA/YrhL